jgi:hypothetical protein
MRGVLSIVAQVAVTIGWFLFFAATGTGCAPANPHGVELNAGPALDVILATYASQAAQPAVYGVQSDCSDMHDGATGYGFWLDGACRGGLTTDAGIFIVLHPKGARFSHNLAHEVCHYLAGGDFDPGHTSPCFAQVSRAQAALVASLVDVVTVGVGGFDRTVGQ